LKAWFGIDSGKDGAVAVVTEDGLVDIHETPTVDVGKGSKREYDIGGMVQSMEAFKAKYELHGHYESVHAFAGQGVSSMFSQGRGYGIWEGILFTLHIPFEYVTPQRWKKALLDGLPKEKGSSVVAASRLFPDYRHLLVTPRNRLKDGNGDALLIAEYSRRCSLGLTS
jgi:crossover junction endodeoxyribonuclease RuvC